MQRAKGKSNERQARVQSLHGKPVDAVLGKSEPSPELGSLRKRLLEMIVRHETERQAKPK